jgi:hypothetical protein
MSTPANPQDLTSYVWIEKLDSEGKSTPFIPEFSSIAILILAVMVCFVAVAFRKRWLRPKSASPAYSATPLIGSRALHQ